MSAHARQYGRRGAALVLAAASRAHLPTFAAHARAQAAQCALALAGWCLGTALRAESVVWSEARTVDCPVAVSSADQDLTRTVVFPCQAISSYLSPSHTRDVSIQLEGHALILRLNSATFEATVPVWDDEGRLYTLRVRSPGEGEAPDDTLVIRSAGRPERLDRSDGAGAMAPGWGAPTRDTDQAVLDLIAEMALGRASRRTHASHVTTWIRGVAHEGRAVVLDDTFSITVYAVYQTDALFGYVCRMAWRSDLPFAIDIQRLWRPGYLAVCPVNQDLHSAIGPHLTIPPHGEVTVLYVTDARMGGSVLRPSSDGQASDRPASAASPGWRP
jgi:hypothetical protein